MLRPRISLHPKKILSVDRKGVLNLQFSIVFHRISSFNPLPDCKFGTPLAAFHKTFRSTDYQ